METCMTGKKILVVLTNEAFIPQHGRGGRRVAMYDGPNHLQIENAPDVQYSPSAWTSPLTTIRDPPATFNLPNSITPLDEFTRTHRKTGVDILELGYFWLKFAKEYKAELTFVSPRGGPVALDPISIETMEKDDKLKNSLKEEREFMMKLGHTYPISWVQPDEYELVLIPGGHGAMFDLPEHDDVAKVIARVYENKKFVGAIGHGVSALLNVQLPKSDEYLVKGKKVTCFTTAEEKEKRFDEFLPYYLEEKLRERGANIQVSKPFSPNVVVEDRLITGQSWPSIHEFVSKITEQCHRSRR